MCGLWFLRAVGRMWYGITPHVYGFIRGAVHGGTRDDTRPATPYLVKQPYGFY